MRSYCQNLKKEKKQPTLCLEEREDRGKEVGRGREQRTEEAKERADVPGQDKSDPQSI